LGFYTFIFGFVKRDNNISTLLIGAEGAKTPAGVRNRGDPTGACAEEAHRTARGKRSAWSANQQVSLKGNFFSVPKRKEPFFNFGTF